MISKTDLSRPWAILLLVLCICLTMTQVSSADDDPLQTVGGWSFGSSSAVAFDSSRDIVFLGSGGVVLALDATDLANPQLLSDEINTMGLVTGLRYDAATQRLLVAANSEDLQIWDVQDPAAPVRLSQFEVQTVGVNPPVRNVDLYGHYALVELDWIGAASIDVSDPTNPVLIDINSSAGYTTTDIQVSSDGYLHVVGSEYYARIPIEEDGTIPGYGGVPIGNARVVFGTPSAAFIEKYGDLQILNYQGSTESLTDVGYFYDMAVRGNTAYLSGGSDLMIYDVSDLANPSFLGSAPGGSRKLDVSEPYAFLAGGSNGLRVVDVSDPADPQAVGSYATYGSTRTTEVVGDHAYIAQGPNGVLILDLTDRAHPYLVGSYDTPGSADDVKAVGSYAFVADYDGGLRIADVSDPAHPAEVGSAEVSNAYIVTVAGDRAYVIENVLNDADVLHILDVSDPADPAELGSFQFASDVREIDVSGDYLFAAADDLGLRILDVSDPASPEEVGSYVAANTWDVQVRGDYAYVASADWYGGFMTFDVSDPTNPMLLSSYTPDNGWYHPFDMTVSGDFAYLSDPTKTTGGVVMLHIGDPTAPVELASYSPPGDLLDLFAADSLLYISDGDAGLRIVKNNVFSAPGGGVGWTAQESGTNEDLRSVFFVSQTTGWVVGDNGTILRTQDAGATWVSLNSGTTEDLFGLCFVDENTGWVGGREGVLLKTTDGGDSWVALDPGTTAQFRAIKFLDADLGWVVGGGGTILKTTDGGASWQPQTSGSTTYLMSVSFVDPDHGWITGGNGDEALTLKTTDGGDNWVAGPPPAPTVSLDSIFFVDQNVGWLAGYDATVYKSTDGGDSWVEQFNDSGTSYTSINCVYAISENTCWGVGGVGVEGRSMKTVDGGEDWMQLLGGDNEYLQSVYFVDSINGWAVGHYGMILAATTNRVDRPGPTGVEEPPVSDGGEQALRLIQNYPNPFSSGTTISYDLPAATKVDLRVFDVAGRLIRVLEDAAAEEPGNHRVAWDGRDHLGRVVPTGVYLCRLDAGSSHATLRMLSLR